MTKHLDSIELDIVQQTTAAGKTAVRITSRRSVRKGKKGLKCPTVNNIRRAIKGKNHCRGKKETRGRKKAISPKKLQCIDRVRVEMLKQA